MIFYDDEVISIADGETKTLTRSVIDNSPGLSKAARAVITCFTANVAYRFDGVPDTSTNEYHLLTAGSEPFTVDGYDNLVNLQFKLASGVTTAKLFVSYAN